MIRRINDQDQLWSYDPDKDLSTDPDLIATWLGSCAENTVGSVHFMTSEEHPAGPLASETSPLASQPIDIIPGRLGRVRPCDAEQGDALRGGGRGRVASAPERDALSGGSVRGLAGELRWHGARRVAGGVSLPSSTLFPT